MTDYIMDNVALAQVRGAVLRLANGMEDKLAEHDPNFRAALASETGWNLFELLKIGAVCAFIKGIDINAPSHDAAVVLTGLANRGLLLEDAPTPSP
ncbi:hypothetical protein JQ631_28745 [Bradyrhizobium manausense]|uniref:hypothetical protein n=1 Tax=Bradyrhizobium manausense TaxID=989370 RepID=UPI001BAE009E|nr:hypothetical protein [Bradyrhizobium manausense]MBR0793081.1 hypothetical protein [Bradyrhizobium manausense]